MRRVLLVTEYLNPPYDEGIKKTVYNLYKELEDKYNLCVICRQGFPKNNINIVKTNSLFLSLKVKKIITKFEPEVMIYFPFASMTFAGYLRLFVLKKHANNAKIIVFALQPKIIKGWQKMIAAKIKADVALSPSPDLIEFWGKMNFKNQLLPLYTELKDFKTIQNKNEKELLRAKYNLPIDKYIISHMGHLNLGRNLESLIPLQQAGYQVVIVGSSSTPKDSLGPISLKEKLINSGIIIIDKFIENIEEIYQLSDLYIFPVVGKCSSIGLPLSVLEARACGIPVVTTDFGSLKQYLGIDHGGIFYSEPEFFLNTLDTVSAQQYNYNKTLIHSINENFKTVLFGIIEK